MRVEAKLMERAPGTWEAVVGGDRADLAPIRCESREGCMREVERLAGLPADRATLVVEVSPLVAGVAEAAEVMGWDKRRVITYVSRGRFPRPAQALASGRIWLRSDVQRFSDEWHARRDRRAGEGPARRERSDG